MTVLPIPGTLTGTNFTSGAGTWTLPAAKTQINGVCTVDLTGASIVDGGGTVGLLNVKAGATLHLIGGTFTLTTQTSALVAIAAAANATITITDTVSNGSATFVSGTTSDITSSVTLRNVTATGLKIGVEIIGSIDVDGSTLTGASPSVDPNPVGLHFRQDAAKAQQWVAGTSLSCTNSTITGFTSNAVGGFLQGDAILAESNCESVFVDNCTLGYNSDSGGLDSKANWGTISNCRIYSTGGRAIAWHTNGPGSGSQAGGGQSINNRIYVPQATLADGTNCYAYVAAGTLTTRNDVVNAVTGSKNTHGDVTLTQGSGALGTYPRVGLINHYDLTTPTGVAITGTDVMDTSGASTATVAYHTSAPSVIGTVAVGAQVENATNATSIALPYPATDAGDMLVVAVAAKSLNLITVPAGFTSIARFSGTTNTLQPSLLLAYKAATGSETGNLTVTTPNVSSIGQLWSVPGVDLVNPLNVAASTKDQTTPLTTLTIPLVTVGSDGCLLVLAATDNSTTHTATPPAGFTETADLSGGQMPLEFAWNLKPTAGATANEVVTWSGSAKAIGVLAPLNPRVAPIWGAPFVNAHDATVTVSSLTSPAPGTGTGVVAANDATVDTSRAHAESIAGAVAAYDALTSSSGLVGTADVAAGSRVVPGVILRVRAVWDDGAFDVWRGQVDSWNLDWFMPSDGTATCEATDVVKRIALSQRDPLPDPINAGDDTGTRISDILDSAGWNHVDRIIAVGDSTLQATDLSGNAWNEALTAASSEGGELFADQGGRIVFRNRRAALTDNALTVPQAVFGDNLTAVFNLVSNPSFASSIAGWTRGGTVLPTLQWTADDHYSGAINDSNALRVLWGAGGTGPQAGTTVTGLTVGQTYTASMYVNVPTGSPDVYVAVPTLAAGTATSVKDAWDRISCTFVATAVNQRVQVQPSTSPVSGDTVLIDAVQVEVGSSPSTYDDDNLPAELPLHDVEVSYDDDALWNLVGATNEGGERQEATDGDSVARYGTRAYEATGLVLQTDADAANYAGYVRYLCKDPELRISALTVHPNRAPDDLFPVVLGLRYGDRIRVNLAPPGGGARISRDCYIRGIAHTINLDGTWETRFVTQTATKAAFWTIADPVLGLVGSMYLSF